MKMLIRSKIESKRKKPSKLVEISKSRVKLKSDFKNTTYVPRLNSFGNVMSMPTFNRHVLEVKH